MFRSKHSVFLSVASARLARFLMYIQLTVMTQSVVCNAKRLLVLVLTRTKKNNAKT